ncbi:MAG: hypothetical protein JXA42_09210, partial [Anaerolineales bacterium]|nr:hypothetical protein [Anaerolineales bacterium]
MRRLLLVCFCLFMLTITALVSASADDAMYHCEPPVYYGVQLCISADGAYHAITVDLNDPHVWVQPVLPLNDQGEECNSVESIVKDNQSNCPYPYPLETIESMLERYRSQGAVAIINADYFGCNGNIPSDGSLYLPCGGNSAHRGAQGLTVRNGVRLDGRDRGDNDGNGETYPSLTISVHKQGTIAIQGDSVNLFLQSSVYNAVGGAPIIVSGGQIPTDYCQGNYPGSYS